MSNHFTSTQCNLSDLRVLFPMCTEMIHDWELYSDHQDVDPEVVRQNTEMAQGIVTWMRKLDLSPREPIATDESTEAHDCEDTYSNSQNTTVQIQQSAENIVDIYLFNRWI